MSYFMVDVESDGPIPWDYSMVCFGAVVVEPSLSKTFYGQTRPISERWDPDSLAISGYTREETLEFDDPQRVMQRFAEWIAANNRNGRPQFISDNNGYDWSFINWYFHHFLGDNPFGFSSANVSSLYKGLVKDTFSKHHHLRKTAHTHHPVDDAIGDAEALLQLKAMGLSIRLK